MIQLAMESSTHFLVDKALGCLPTILNDLDFSTIKHDVFPVVAAVFSKTASLAIKIRGLEAFAILCGGLSSSENDDRVDGLDGAQNDHSTKRTSLLDKFTVQEKIVPLLKAIKTKEPACMMAALAVFRQVGKIADSDFLAIEVLPILWSFSLGPLLNINQFKDFMGLIRTLSAKIEEEQAKKLLELSSNSVDGFGGPHPKDLMSAAMLQNGNFEIGHDDFERLVLGERTGAGADMLGNSQSPQAHRSQSASAETPVFTWPTPSNPSNTTSGILTPPPASNAQAIAPDHSLSSFAPLKPLPSGGLHSSMGWSQGALPTFQSLNPASQWASNTITANKMPGGVPTLAFGPLPAPNTSFSSITLPPPPLTSGNLFHSMQPAQLSSPDGFSIAPPPGPSRVRNTQTPYGGGLGVTGRTVAPSSFQTPATDAQKKGLDAYESLL